ncbi:nucleotidyltransferase domain-containing protein [Halobacillus rhizosphaerae]|uniref:DNA polymerase beta superfamily protein n=1 Tax=Halobacillus rhizosphaerae TaxID=3064889 RepID=UPI00398B9FD6
MQKIEDRIVLFRALVGSHNYNLNDETSDRDYKVFIAPTFDDLYNKEVFSKQTIGTTEDIDVHDIRKLPHLFYKSNINFLEPLFSIDQEIETDTTHSFLEIGKMIQEKDEIAKMNLKQLFDACGGTFRQKMQLLNKPTEGTQHLADKFGYDTKQAQHAFRNLDFIVRFEANDFKDFKSAITYHNEDRDFVMGFKQGAYSQEEFIKYVNWYHDTYFLPLKEKYHSFAVDEEVNEWLKETVKKIVKAELFIP